MASRWFYSMLGEEFGPVDEGQLLALRDGGMLGPTDEVRRDGDSAWQPLSLALASPVPKTGSSSNIDIPNADVDEANWYYELLGEQFGPLTFDELADLAKSGTLGSEDQVKFGSDGKYRRVGSIGRLVAVLPYQDPVTANGAPSANVAPPPVPVKAQATSSTEPPMPSAPPTPPPAPSIRYAPGAEELAWFAWIQGSEYGPTNLLKLAEWSKTGQLAGNDSVRYGPQGNWVPSHPTVEQALSRFVIVDSAPHAGSYAPPPRPSEPPHRVASPSPVSPPPPRTTTPPPPAKSSAVPDGSWQDPSKLAKSIPPVRLPPPPVKKSTPREPVATVAPPPKPTPAPPPPVTRPAVASPPPSAVSAGSMSASSMSSSSMSSSYGSMSGSRPAMSPPKPAPKRSSSSGGGISLNLGGMFKDTQNLPGMIALGVIGLIAAWLFLMPASTAADRERLAQLQQIIADMEAKRESKVPQKEWDLFVIDTRKAVKPIIEELKKTASGTKPAQQNLLWAAERLPVIIEQARDKPAPAENEVAYYLKKAAFILGEGPDPDKDLPAAPPTEDPAMAGMAPPP